MKGGVLYVTGLVTLSLIFWANVHDLKTQLSTAQAIQQQQGVFEDAMIGLVSWRP